MAESLDDGEFWLPPQFLTDEDTLMDMSKNNNVKKSNNYNGDKKDGFDLDGDVVKSFFPFEFSYGFGSFGLSSSDLSSPVESVVGSTETESDEEDYLSGLTRQMADSTLEEGFKRSDHAFASEKTKGLFLSGSPQSTLCVVGSGCGCKQGSSRGSPNCQSQLSSLPGTWDLLYAAAGEVAKMRMTEESYGGERYNNRGGLLGGGPQRKQSPVSVPLKNHQQNLIDHVGFYSQHHNHQSLSQQKLQQATQFQQLKQQQMMKQQQQQASSVWGGGPQQTKGTGQYQVGLNFNNRPRTNTTTTTNDFVGTRNSGRPLGLSPSAWPPLQQQPSTQTQQQQHQNGSGMRAVFLGAPGAKRECAGTGVFLPRRINTPTETRKKPGCSTVLLPAKVVQALNLNFDDMSVPLQPRFGSCTPDTDAAAAAAALRYRNSNNNGNGNGLTTYQKQQRGFRSQPGMINHHEIRLPPEWTY